MEGRHAGHDFFLITSVNLRDRGYGSNYCAANDFLGAFAHHRRSQGLYATVLDHCIISEMGYLHKHLEIEAILARKSIYAINEDEMP